MEWISDVEELRVGDINMTYKAKYKGVPCVLKFFVDKNYTNHEWELLQFFQQHSKHPEWYPKPYFINTSITELELPVFGTVELVEDIFKIICYEYIQSQDYYQNFDANKACVDLVQHLNDMHKMGIVHADVQHHNIILGIDGRYKLIDYGISFSYNNKQYPPLRYMVESGEIPSITDDILSVAETINSLTPKRVCKNCKEAF